MQSRMIGDIEWNEATRRFDASASEYSKPASGHMTPWCHVTLAGAVTWPARQDARASASAGRYETSTRQIPNQVTDYGYNAQSRIRQQGEGGCREEKCRSTRPTAVDVKQFRCRGSPAETTESQHFRRHLQQRRWRRRWRASRRAALAVSACSGRGLGFLLAGRRDSNFISQWDFPQRRARHFIGWCEAKQ